MASTEELIVRIGADFDELKKGLKKAGEETEKFGKGVDDTSKDVAASFGKIKTSVLAAVASIAAASLAIEKFRGHVATSAREQRLWARRLDISVESFSALATVGRRFGAEIDDVGDSIKDLNERIADAARGNATYGDALKIIGLNAKELINIPIEEQFIKTADAIGKLNNAGDQNFVVAELMADAGFRLLPAFRAGEKGIRDMLKSVKDLNASFTEEEVKLYESYDKALISLKEAAFAVAKPLANELTMALTGAATATANVLRDTVAYRQELQALRKELEATATSGDVLSSEVGAIEIGFKQAGGSFDQLAQSIKDDAQTVVEEVARMQEASVGREGLQFAPVRMGGLEVDGDLNEMLEKAMAGPDLSEQFEMALSSQEEFQNGLLDIKRRSEYDMTKVQQENAEARMKITEMENRARMDAMKGIFGNLSTLMNTENRKLFEIGKASAIAQATISTYEGANKALGSAPPPFNFALAASVVATGLANIAQISSTTLGGGGGASGASPTGGATGGATLVQENVIDASFNIEGTNVSKDSIRSVFSELQEYIDDGAKLRTVSVN